MAVEKQTRLSRKSEKRHRNNPAGSWPTGFRAKEDKVMEKKHKNKVRVLPGRMYRLVRSDRSVYCDAENALRTCFIEETKEQQAAREEGELCRFVRMAPDGGVELISNAGNVVRFKNAEDLTKTLRFAKDVLRITEVLKNGNRD
jgi:hypothetical protein